MHHNHPGSSGIPKFSNVQRVESHDSKNISILHIDSMDRLPITDYSAPRFSSNNDIVKNDIVKMAVSEISIYYNIPNINVTNNTISFESSLGLVGTIYTVTIPTGFYDVPTLMAEIVVQLNSVSAASDLKFTLTTNLSNTYLISSEKVGGGVGLFKLLSSSHIDRAESLSGLYPTLARISSQLVSPQGLYTRYIDFLSVDIRENQVLPNLFTKDLNYGIINHFYRYYIKDGTTTFSDIKEIKNLSYVPTEPKTKQIFELQLYNQYGDRIYSPVFSFGTGVNKQTVNTDLLKYSLKISIAT